MTKVLLIDDDPILTRHYSEALGVQGYDTTVITRTSDALAFDARGFSLVVCDLMMEDDGHFQAEGTKNGLLTGLRLVEWLRSNAIDVPCVILTSLNIEPVFEELKAGAEGLQDVLVLRKSEFDPIEFAQIAIHIIKRESIPNLSPAFGKRLADSVVLQPNFAGVGIDLKKLFGFKNN